MAYNTKSIIKDRDNKPAPQYFNQVTDNYEVARGVSGMLRTIRVDGDGKEVVIQSTLDQISAKLTQLIGVVNK